MNSKSNQVILFMDPRGIIFKDGQDTIIRLQKYANEISKLSKGRIDKVVVFSSSVQKNNEIDEQFFRLLNVSNPTFNFISFAIKSQNILKQEKYYIRVLVAGDPWESFWAARLISFLQKSFTPIQVQVHGDFANPSWRRINFRNRIRFNTLKYSLARADSIRTVGTKQTKQIRNLLDLSYKKFVIVPVPIIEVDKIPLNRSARPTSIAIIGRIHEDRGIWNFISLIESLSSIRNDFKVIIIGSGPSQEKFLAGVSTYIPENRCKYIEFLDQDQLRKFWSQFGVLVSLAPAESYGRAMREALVAGVPVWATKSSGVEDLILKAGKDAVRILDLTKSSNELSLEFDQLLKSKVPISFRKQFIKDNSTYARLLAQSWVELINKQKN